MDSYSDAELACLLQQQFDSEAASQISTSEISGEYGDSGPSLADQGSATSQMGIVDTGWELIDPHPDIRALFMQFNYQFFWGRLEGVEVRWSPRMTLCAGLCCYEGYGGLCSVRLSAPLLKLRPRKDLVETLLHEMIHAYLFVTQNNKDHDGHGPEFCKHMNRINTATGTNISIYHTFHDEVDSYRQHWWRCNGPCQKRKPYFGYVKRAMNRAPSPKDFWWGEHQKACGGTYTKIKEPEGYGEKKGGKKKTGEGVAKDAKDSKDADDHDKPSKNGMDIRNFIPFSGKGKALGGESSSSSSSSSASTSTTSHWKPKVGTTTTKVNATSNSSGDRFQDANSTSKHDSMLSRTSTSATSSVNKMPTTGQSNSSSSVWKTPTTAGSSTCESGKSSATSTVVTEPTKASGFIPKIATASGHPITDTTASSGNADWFHSSEDFNAEADSEYTKPKISRKFIPVVAAVGRKENSSSKDKCGRNYGDNPSAISNAPRNDASSEIKRHSSSASTSSRPSLFSHPNVLDGPGVRDGGNNGKNTYSVRDQISKTDVAGTYHSKGNVQNRSKRARLVDLSTMFDSDSDSDELRTKPVKIPRYSLEGETGNSSGVSESSDKENSIFVSDQSQDTRSVILIADNDEFSKPSQITSGIWRDLSHTTASPVSNNKAGNRRFGRVPPPIWKKSGATRMSQSSQKNVPPHSSFSEHPWQTAARESVKQSPSVAKVTDTSGAICVFSDDEDDSNGTGDGRDGSVGPRTVPCPVCNLQIEETKINSHLDTCLTYNCEALFSP